MSRTRSANPHLKNSQHTKDGKNDHNWYLVLGPASQKIYRVQHKYQCKGLHRHCRSTKLERQRQ